MTIAFAIGGILAGMLVMHTLAGRAKAYEEAYNQGRWAAESGLPPDNNPYDTGPQSAAWYRGWRDYYGDGEQA